jgi:hypothetical protein
MVPQPVSFESRLISTHQRFQLASAPPGIDCTLSLRHVRGIFDGGVRLGVVVRHRRDPLRNDTAGALSED